MGGKWFFVICENPFSWPRPPLGWTQPNSPPLEAAYEKCYWNPCDLYNCKMAILFFVKRDQDPLPSPPPSPSYHPLLTELQKQKKMSWCWRKSLGFIYTSCVQMAEHNQHGMIKYSLIIKSDSIKWENNYQECTLHSPYTIGLFVHHFINMGIWAQCLHTTAFSEVKPADGNFWFWITLLSSLSVFDLLLFSLSSPMDWQPQHCWVFLRRF